MPLDFNIDLTDINTPRLSDYFGVWAIMEDPFRQACEYVEGVDLHQHIEQSAGPKMAGAGDYQVTEGGIAVVSLSGPLMKQASSLSGGTSTVRARAAIRAAANDTNVSGILLRIDSPGGTAAGTQALADDVAAANQKKPVYSYIEDLGASAAYWVASQAQKVFTNPTGLVGSIGTFMVLEDMSAMAAQKGVKVHVVRAGAMKGSGTPGTEITPQQLEHFQGIVDSLNEHFVRAVAQGRSLSLVRIRELADGRVHVGEAAKALGLVDAVQSFDETLHTLSQKMRKGKIMSTETTAPAQETAPAAPVAASYQDVVSVCRGIKPDNAEDSKFVCEQLAKQATKGQALAAWMDLQQKRVEDANARAEAAQKAADTVAKPPLPGGKALGSNATNQTHASENGDPQSQVEDLVRAEMGRGVSRYQAFQNVMRKNPELRQSLVASVN